MNPLLTGSVDSLEDAVVKKVTELTVRMQGQGLTCIYNIQKHYPSFVRRWVYVLYNGIFQFSSMCHEHLHECLVSEFFDELYCPFIYDFMYSHLYLGANPVCRLINKLLNLLPKLYGIHRTHVLECLIAHSATMEDIYLHLKEQNLLDILAKKFVSYFALFVFLNYIVILLVYRWLLVQLLLVVLLSWW